ncbi:MAG: hypothetical protein WHS46_04895 [Desulfosoma sp.]
MELVDSLVSGKDDWDRYEDLQKFVTSLCVYSHSAPDENLEIFLCNAKN